MDANINVGSNGRSFTTSPTTSSSPGTNSGGEQLDISSEEWQIIDAADAEEEEEEEEVLVPTHCIAVLRAAPLVCTNDRRQLTAFPRYDIELDVELMLGSCLPEAAIVPLSVTAETATYHTLRHVLTQTTQKKGRCLHYVGHGHSRYLVLEDGSGGPNWIKVEDIRWLLSNCNCEAEPFQFVFVSSCHAETAGEIFAGAGVSHVVCCQRSPQLKEVGNDNDDDDNDDTTLASRAFTRQFYFSLVKGRTVRESFEQAVQAATRYLHNPDEAATRFLLLPRDGNHEVSIFARTTATPMPQLQNPTGCKQVQLNFQNNGWMQENPAPKLPHCFLGRQLDMFYVSKAILCKRLVGVIAQPGYGRSTLVSAVAHYMNERATTMMSINRIYYARARQGGIRGLLEDLIRKIIEYGKEDPPDPAIGSSYDDMVAFICTSLKKEKVLLVVDHIEVLENEDEFPLFLDALFRNTQRTKVLYTGLRSLVVPEAAIRGQVKHPFTLGGQIHYPYPLKALALGDTLLLFAKLCPHFATADERRNFIERVGIEEGQSKLRPCDSGINERTKEIFRQIGNGIPRRIKDAARIFSAEQIQTIQNR